MIQLKINYFETVCSVCGKPTCWDKSLGDLPLCEDCWDKDLGRKKTNKAGRQKEKRQGILAG